ncbi:hypothetical protein E2C01_040844 [Portunus trituberculatus]|uniref:Uncharacterized protein n=1 Tax=Portunus trituberculatus TaxID=210409 RepID=A0A5B7FPB1_PORTR|nr:hypothetical protein [Portunus trituberculatus]
MQVSPNFCTPLATATATPLLRDRPSTHPTAALTHDLPISHHTPSTSLHLFIPSLTTSTLHPLTLSSITRKRPPANPAKHSPPAPQLLSSTLPLISSIPLSS